MESNHNSSVDALSQYISNAKEILAKFETGVGWSSPDLKDVEDSVIESGVCPHDSNHIIPKPYLSRHTKSCKWKQLGYSASEVREIIENSVREDSGGSISTDAVISKIAPVAPQIRTDKHHKCHLSPDQRLAVYEEEVRQCYSSGKPMPDKALYADLEAQAAEKLYRKENPEKLSEVELMQKMRDMKKRRQSYRAKNVHITKRSQTEIIRGVLEVHMEELSRLWNAKAKNDKKSDSDGDDLMHYERRKTAHSDNHEIDDNVSPARHHSHRLSFDRKHHSSSKYDKQYSSEFGSRSGSSCRNGDHKPHSSSRGSRKDKDVSFSNNFDRRYKSKEGGLHSSKRHSLHKESSHHKLKRSKHSHR